MTNILVVDDSAVDRRIVGGLLEQRSDFHVVYAEDGTDALRKMETTRPDIVVTDINMPREERPGTRAGHADPLRQACRSS